MRKLTKTLAALLLMLAVVVAAGCKKPDDPTDPNNPNNGGGGNGGGNGGGETPTTEGIYLGIIGFNYNLFPKEIGFLDNSTKSSFTSFIDNLTTENLTALYYADYTALKNLNLYSEPPRLTNVALVTFTDGLDNASLDDDERNPENYPTRDAYLNALHSKIKTEKIHGLDVNAYTIGLRGNDVHDVVAFQNNLKKLASDDQNVFEVTSMDEALQHFEEIAESLHWTSVTTSLTLLVPPGYDDGMVLRFTFDQGNSAANSALCIECTYKRGDNVRRLENIQYIGFEQGASSLSSVEKLPNGFYKFVFEQLEKKNGQGYITEDDRNRMKLYRRISTGWEPETEFDNSNQSSIVNEQNSALIMLVLDCTTSLGSQFSSLKVGAKNFVETLVNANSGGGGLTRFTVSVSANPNEAGTVSGGGTFNSGALRTITATANDGYSFTNWTENGNEVSTNPNYSFTLNTNRTFVANFTATAPNQYTINVSANPTEGGTVSGGGAFNSGTSRTVTATANDGYSFTNWTENGNVVSTSANYTFTVNTNQTLVANFTANAPNQYTINVSANPTEGGTVSGGGTFNSGPSRTVTATANEGYSFTNWTENGSVVSTNANYTFTVTTNRTLVANFTANAPNQYTINVLANPTDGGMVGGGGAYEQGDTCTVRTTANSGYAFINWTENGDEVSTSANYTFIVNGHRTLVANFEEHEPETYTVSVSANPSNGGTVGGGGTFQQGESCTVHANANAGYTFTNWTENGNVVSTNANYTFTVMGNRTLKANFTAQTPDTYTITAGVTPTGSGTTTGAGTYQQGQSCTLVATAASGYVFQKWTKNGTQVSTNATYTFTVTESASYIAHFQPQTFTISTNANPSSGGTTTGDGTYNYGQNCTLRATPSSGYSFVKWTKNGTQVSTNSVYTFAVTASGSYVAHFDQQSYNISLSASPSNGGTVSGGGIHYYGQSCTVHATANSGYTFTNWTENGNVVSTNANYNFTVTGNRTLVAHFTANPQNYTISVSANPSNGGGVSGGGTYQQGQSCTVHATANTNYSFTNWTENGNVVSTNANYTFTVNNNRTLVAHFAYSPQAPTGAINGLFSVSPTQQVYFSQGNLQYRASTNTWQFATNQYDYIGSNNSNISQNYGGWIDLFGWGTSGWNCGNTYYRPWDSDNSCDYCYGPLDNYNLTGPYAHSDWGMHNAISNGGDVVGQWRTLTLEEWVYIFNTRSTSSGIRYAKAQVNNVNGMILLPDNWSSSYYTLYSTNQVDAGYSSNVISSSVWTNSLQSHGAVFLPGAGLRDGVLISSLGWGNYWSASHFGSYGGFSILFNGFDFQPEYFHDRYYGLSVRLVYSAE